MTAAIETNRRAIFWWIVVGLFLSLSAATTLIPTTSAVNALEQSVQSPPTATIPPLDPNPEPDTALYSEAPGHNPCAYPDDCRRGHKLVVRECGELTVTAKDDRFPNQVIAYPTDINSECLPWWPTAQDGIPGEVCGYSNRFYHNGELISHQWAVAPGHSSPSAFVLDVNSDYEEILMELIFRCTFSLGDFGDLDDIEYHEFYRS